MAKRPRPSRANAGTRSWAAIGAALELGFEESRLITKDPKTRSAEMRGWVRLALEYQKVEELRTIAADIEASATRLEAVAAGAVADHVEDPKGDPEGGEVH